MTDNDDQRRMPEKSREWIQALALENCRRRPGCGILEAVLIAPTKPRGSGPNWELIAFKPELHRAAYHEAMQEIHKLRGTYALAKRETK